jgi:hypothetical protein
MNTDYQKDREFSSGSEYINFAKSPGSMTKSEEITIKNSLDRLICKVMIATNMETNEKKYGLMLSVIRAISVGSTERYNTTLDVDEIDKCLKMFLYINEKVIQTPANEVVTGYSYYGKDNGLIGIGTNQKAWTIFINPYLYKNESMLYYKSNQLPELIRVFSEAKGIISERDE